MKLKKLPIFCSAGCYQDFGQIRIITSAAPKHLSNVIWTTLEKIFQVAVGFNVLLVKLLQTPLFIWFFTLIEREGHLSVTRK